ncbi:hypothetical protein MACH21_29300 [Roseicyclus marinus]|uniref:Uncharacterized protein n=1 Tax=Roseicyclus marinus TaxID=2161673 RepID=A0AA48HEF4_9RHOB|nr:hypothetical protein MACH21_29300 [Roseicyclus marinus]
MFGSSSVNGSGAAPQPVRATKSASGAKRVNRRIMRGSGSEKAGTGIAQRGAGRKRTRLAGGMSDAILIGKMSVGVFA